MKFALISLTAASLLMGMVDVAIAQDSTVIHKESADGNRSKTIVKDDTGKTVTKRHGPNMKKVHTDPNGDKTVVTKTVE